VTDKTPAPVPEQSDNRPRPEDGPQDVDQAPEPYPDSPTSDEASR
jgi:hypothetical protein